MRKAYIITAHKNPRQLFRLVSRLNDGNSEFFIHIDKKAEFSQFQILNEIGNKVHFLERFDSKWGSYGTIKPFLSGLRTIKNTPEPFDRIMLLSGQDYPIKSNAEIDHFFNTSPYTVFLNYFPIPNYDKWPGNDRGGWYRVDKYYFGTKGYELFFSKALNMLATYLPFLRRQIPDGMKPYTGQTWWNLDNYALNYIVDYVDKHPEYLAFHKNTFVADELFVQMIVGNSTDKKLLNSICNSEKRFTIWEDPTNAHPKLLTKADIDAISSSDDLFARKFDDEVDAEILDMIDNPLLYKKNEKITIRRYVANGKV